LRKTSKNKEKSFIPFSHKKLKNRNLKAEKIHDNTTKTQFKRHTKKAFPNKKRKQFLLKIQ